MPHAHRKRDDFRDVVGMQCKNRSSKLPEASGRSLDHEEDFSTALSFSFPGESRFNAGERVHAGRKSTCHHLAGDTARRSARRAGDQHENNWRGSRHLCCGLRALGSGQESIHSASLGSIPPSPQPRAEDDVGTHLALSSQGDAEIRPLVPNDHMALA